MLINNVEMTRNAMVHLTVMTVSPIIIMLILPTAFHIALDVSKSTKLVNILDCELLLHCQNANMSSGTSLPYFIAIFLCSDITCTLMTFKGF